MAVIRDMIPAFELFQPTTIDDAIELLDRYGDRGWALAGGLDSLDWFKDRIKRPEAVIELGSIESLHGIDHTTDGLVIGATTPLALLTMNAEIRQRYAVLSLAAGDVATPQIRNQGTLGGNLIQDTRCWYYRGGWPCYRAGGNTCYAATPLAMNREHCVAGANRCVAVNGSDTAPALIALDAEMVVRSPSGERVVPAADFFIGPDIDITRMTVLQPGDLLTHNRVPQTMADSRFYWEKVRDRKSWDWALTQDNGRHGVKHDHGSERPETAHRGLPTRRHAPNARTPVSRGGELSPGLLHPPGGRRRAATPAVDRGGGRHTWAAGHGGDGRAGQSARDRGVPGPAAQRLQAAPDP